MRALLHSYPACVSEHENGVFGQLPRRRPSLRSPLRDRRRAATPPPIDDEAPADEPDVEHGALEDLTLAGIGAATDLLVLGIKLSGRAFGVVTRR
jgi:hypothetical protein